MGTEEQCLADFTVRSRTRLNYPGACSLEYQNLKQIIIETLLQWDVNKQTAKGVGIVGTTLAFAPADEEQGRGTLHSHWQIWTKELNQNVRDMLFHDDPDKRSRARHFFCAHIDAIMSATYGTDLIVTHKCKQGDTEVVKTDIAENIYCDCKAQILRKARHKILLGEIKGKIAECKVCREKVSTTDIINNALARWKEHAIKSTTKSRPDLTLPISPARLDMAAYTYSYHLDGGCHPLKDLFWGNKDIRTALLTLRFEEHSWGHRNSCFKKVKKFALLDSLYSSFVDTHTSFVIIL